MVTSEDVAKEYHTLVSVERSLRQAVDTNIPEGLEPLVHDVQELELRIIESSMVFGSSGEKVDITEHVAKRLSSAVLDLSPALLSVHKAQCKKAARILYTRTHPDKGGDPVEFDLVRKAAESLDLDYLYLKLLDVEGSGVLSPEVLIERVRARLKKTRASSLGRVAVLKMTGSPSYESELERWLVSRKIALTLVLNTPDAVPEHNGSLPVQNC